MSEPQDRFSVLVLKQHIAPDALDARVPVLAQAIDVSDWEAREALQGAPAVIARDLGRDEARGLLDRLRAAGFESRMIAATRSMRMHTTGTAPLPLPSGRTGATSGGYLVVAKEGPATNAALSPDPPRPAAALGREEVFGEGAVIRRRPRSSGEHAALHEPAPSVLAPAPALSSSAPVAEGKLDGTNDDVFAWADDALRATATPVGETPADHTALGLAPEAQSAVSIRPSAPAPRGGGDPFVRTRDPNEDVPSFEEGDDPFALPPLRPTPFTAKPDESDGGSFFDEPLAALAPGPERAPASHAAAPGAFGPQKAPGRSQPDRPRALIGDGVLKAMQEPPQEVQTQPEPEAPSESPPRTTSVFDELAALDEMDGVEAPAPAGALAPSEEPVTADARPIAPAQPNAARQAADGAERIESTATVDDFFGGFQQAPTTAEPSHGRGSEAPSDESAGSRDERRGGIPLDVSIGVPMSSLEDELAEVSGLHQLDALEKAAQRRPVRTTSRTEAIGGRATGRHAAIGRTTGAHAAVTRPRSGTTHRVVVWVAVGALVVIVGALAAVYLPPLMQRPGEGARFDVAPLYTEVAWSDGPGASAVIGCATDLKGTICRYSASWFLGRIPGLEAADADVLEASCFGTQTVDGATSGMRVACDLPTVPDEGASAWVWEESVRCVDDPASLAAGETTACEVRASSRRLGEDGQVEAERRHERVWVWRLEADRGRTGPGERAEVAREFVWTSDGQRPRRALWSTERRILLGRSTIGPPTAGRPVDGVWESDFEIVFERSAAGEQGTARLGRTVADGGERALSVPVVASEVEGVEGSAATPPGGPPPR
jgi:hypothetical protein